MHINALDRGGGSARAAYAVYAGVKQLGVQSRMLIRYKNTDDPEVGMIAPGLLRFMDKAVGRGLDHLGCHYLFYPSSFLLLSHRWFREANIVQLYNTHGGYFSHTVLPWLSQTRPVVWRLDDLWALTGGCNYPGDCERWKEGCGCCPHLPMVTSPGLRWDTTASLWKVKDRCFRHSRLTITAPSRWLAGIAAQSPLLGRFPIHFIPYGIDTQVFRPVQKLEARKKLGIDPQSPVIGFGAQDVLDPRKGGIFLSEALERLAVSSVRGLKALIFGSRSGDFKLPASVEAKRFGSVKDDDTLALIYSAADLFVMPSLGEIFGLVALESMACRTPVVAFAVDGVTEHVRHMETGYLAANKDTADLTRGIERILRDKELYAAMANRCRKMVEEEYSQELQAKRYLDLYEDLHKQSLS